MSTACDNPGGSAALAEGMELRLFRQLCLVASILVLLVIAPADYLVKVNPVIIWTDLAFGVAAFCLYLRSRRGQHHILGLFLLYLVNLNICWFSDAAQQGGTSLYFFTAFSYVLIFFRDKKRCLLLALAIGNALWLTWNHNKIAQSLAPYPSAASRNLDLILSLAVSALSCSFMLWGVLSSYDREQRRLTGLNAELERNMAERIEAENSLRQSRELLHAVIEGSLDAIYAKDREGRYVLFNSAAALITGKDSASALGKDDTFLFPADEAAVLMAKDREIMACGKSRQLEHELTNGSGRKIVVQATKGPLWDENGGIVGVVGISRDVTESRRAEEQIRSLNAELDQRVTERTARLRAAIQEQESFSYSISHDLRAPLRHINSYSAILQEEFGHTLTGEAHGYLERIRTASRNMGKLIDDLLELSRIGRSELKRSRVELTELAREIFFRLQAAEPDRKAEFVVAPELTAYGDRVLLHQMLENLLDNAWKYTRPREAARIEMGRMSLGNQDAFFVRDNGVGFDMAYQDKLFGAFQRLHGAEFEGTGIGLATVKRIVKRHGGRVWAEGAVDVGATISFTLR